VGIGNSNPTAKLDVNGRVNIDSTLVVKDSVTMKSNLRVEEDANFMNKTNMKDAEVNQLFKANGESEFNGGVRFTNFSLSSFFSDKYFMVIDAQGNASRVPYDSLAFNLKGTLAAIPMAPMPLDFCSLVFPNGASYADNPYWQSMPNKLVVPCPDVNVGIGTLNPATKLDVWGGVSCEGISIGVNPNQLGTKSFHLRAYNNTNATANAAVFLVENQDRPLFQINNDGIVRTREIKVNLDAAWPDYVFKPNYDLMPLKQVELFISEKGHLPNVPSASEIEIEAQIMRLEKLENNK